MVAIILSEMKRILKSSAISQKYPSKSRILRNPKEIKKIQISPKEAHHFSDRKILIFGKGSKEREVYFGSRCLELLDKYLKDSYEQNTQDNKKKRGDG